MATPAETKLLTAEEFYDLPEPDHGGKMELVDGTVVVHMPVGRPHGRIALRLGARLMEFVDAHRLGEANVEVGYRLRREPDTVMAPDVAFTSNERLALTAEQGFIDAAPTLAVEVTSPSDTDARVADKVRRYLAAGAERVWIVRPNTRDVTVHRPDGSAQLRAEGDALTSDDVAFAVEGFALPVTDIFGAAE